MMLHFKLNKEPKGQRARVSEGFDFLKVDKVIILSGAWEEDGAEMWIDGLHFEFKLYH